MRAERGHRKEERLMNMGKSDQATAEASAGVTQAEVEARSALERAAELAVALGVNLDTFMGAAYAAFLRANPGLRRDIEDVQLLAQVRELRRKGGVPEA
jgi:hypothetical protein